MYDSREKAIRDRQWALNASRNEGIAEGKIEGKMEGEIKLIRALEEILQLPASTENDLVEKSLEELQAIATTLQSKIRSRSI